MLASHNVRRAPRLWGYVPRCAGCGAALASLQGVLLSERLAILRGARPKFVTYYRCSA